MQGIYLDHNATTPPHPRVVDAMTACLREGWGNPSSAHAYGQAARRALDRARAQVADLMHADPDEIVFTSGGTEADNQALRMGARLAGRREILVSAFEHSAVLDTARALEAEGFACTVMPVDREGLVAAERAEAACTASVGLLSVMLANNDVGTLQPVAALAVLARARGILVHSDAVQAFGKVPMDVRELGVDLLSVSAHKLRGPKGAGALFVRRGIQPGALLTGGPQERRLRAGTENLPGIVGFGAACELAREGLEARGERLRALRDRLERGILAGIPGTWLNGHPARRLPNTSSIHFEGLDAQDLLLNLDLEGIAVSTGAACQSSSGRPSRVLVAMGREEHEARSSLRFSLGEDNTEAEVDRVLEVIAGVARRLGARP